MAVLAVLVGGCSAESADEGSATSTGVIATEDDPPDATGDAPAPGPVGERSGPESTGRPTLIDPGSEPRVALRMVDHARARLTVSAVDERSTTVDGVTSDRARQADYDLVVDVGGSGDGFELLIAPTLRTIDGPVPTDDEVGALRWLLDPNGVTQRIVPIRGPGSATSETLALFNIPHLVLATPVEPVGPGARWSQPLGGGSDAELVVTLHDVTDDDLDVTVEVVARLDGGTLTIAANGVYDRATLLARDVVATSTLEIDAPVSVDGASTNLIGMRRSERTYAEVDG